MVEDEGNLEPEMKHPNCICMGCERPMRLCECLDMCPFCDSDECDGCGDPDQIPF